MTTCKSFLLPMRAMAAAVAMAATLKAEWNFPSTYNRLVHGKKDYVGITLTLNNEVSVP